MLIIYMYSHTTSVGIIFGSFTTNQCNHANKRVNRKGLRNQVYSNNIIHLYLLLVFLFYSVHADIYAIAVYRHCGVSAAYF